MRCRPWAASTPPSWWSTPPSRARRPSPGRGVGDGPRRLGRLPGQHGSHHHRPRAAGAHRPGLRGPTPGAAGRLARDRALRAAGPSRPHRAAPPRQVRSGCAGQRGVRERGDDPAARGDGGPAGQLVPLAAGVTGGRRRPGVRIHSQRSHPGSPPGRRGRALPPHHGPALAGRRRCRGRRASAPRSGPDLARAAPCRVPGDDRRAPGCRPAHRGVERRGRSRAGPGPAGGGGPGGDPGGGRSGQRRRRRPGHRPGRAPAGAARRRGGWGSTGCWGACGR